MQEMYRRRRLPHWDRPGATYFVTSCLAGSIPAQGLLSIRTVQNQLVASRPRDESREWKDYVWKKMFVERERWLDLEPEVRHLERADLAAIVCNSLKYFDKVRYHLIAFVVMPSHFHWLFQPLAECESTLPEKKTAREVIMHSIQSYTAHECQRILNRSGIFWQGESFDHCVRDDAELERIFDYIELNPVQARLCLAREHWPFSSAYRRTSSV